MAPGWVIPDTLVDREGELGALGEGPFLKFRTLIFSSRSFSSPWRSPELNRLLKKFIVVCINSVSAVDVDPRKTKTLVPISSLWSLLDSAAEEEQRLNQLTTALLSTVTNVIQH